MNKSLLLYFWLALLPLGGWGQVSFGVKVGGTYQYSNPYPFINLVNDDARKIKQAIDERIGSYQSSPNLIEDNSSLVDSLYEHPLRSRAPISFEYGAYISIPVSIRSRIRFELAYHDFDLQYGINNKDYNYTGVSVSYSKFNFEVPEGDPDGYNVGNLYRFALAGTDEARFIRPSFHYQYYLTKYTALNIGLSYSIALRDINTRGHVFFFQNDYGSYCCHSDGYSLNTGASYNYIEIDPITERSLAKGQGILGLNFGYLFKLWNLPKMELRGSYYFNSLKKGVTVSNDAQLLGFFTQPIKYDLLLVNPDHYTLSLFLEL